MSVRASSMPRSANWAPDVHTFWPSTVHPAFRASALVWALARSEPDPGSEKNWHQDSSPRTRGGRNRAFCSSLPCTSSVGPPSSWPSPAGGPSAPALSYAARTPAASSADMPFPNHGSGHVGKPQPDSARRAHHSRTVRPGSQCAVSQASAASLASSCASDRASGSGMPAAFLARRERCVSLRCRAGASCRVPPGALLLAKLSRVPPRAAPLVALPCHGSRCALPRCLGRLRCRAPPRCLALPCVVSFVAVPRRPCPAALRRLVRCRAPPRCRARPRCTCLVRCRVGGVTVNLRIQF
jgi:hypothetical protein